MSQMIPFESAKLPAHLLEAFGGLTNDLLVSGNGGFPTVSIKGKVFTLKRGDEKTLITRPDSDEPAASLEVVILKAGPAGDKLAKVYYSGGFTEGSDAKPVCFSNDGIKPSINAQSPQCTTCAGCPQNAWGSHVSDEGKKGKACSDSKRLAIAPAGQINDPMLLRVPAASLKALTAFGQQLAKRGVPYQAVIAKIGFDYSVAHPALTFKPVGFVDDATLLEVKEMVDSDVVGRITGSIEDLFVQDKDDDFESKPAPKAAPAAKKPAPAPKPEVDDEDPPAKVKVAVEGEEAPVKKAAPAPKAKVVEIEEDLDEAMGDIDFDD
jgi:hypothetical protein